VFTVAFSRIGGRVPVPSWAFCLGLGCAGIYERSESPPSIALTFIHVRSVARR
jgi:hypothetical protein